MTKKFFNSIQKLDVKLDRSPRDVYLDHIRRILELAIGKYEHKQTKNTQRIAWGRLALQAITAGNQVLQTKETEEVKKRLQQLEEVMQK